MDGTLTEDRIHVDEAVTSGEPNLTNGDLAGAADAVALARRTLRTIRLNAF